MIINPNVILEDEFVLLRPLQETDLEHLLPFSMNEPELWKFSLVRANGKENLEHYIQIAMKATGKWNRISLYCL
jgi:hypothetical protein